MNDCPLCGFSVMHSIIRFQSQVRFERITTSTLLYALLHTCYTILYFRYIPMWYITFFLVEQENRNFACNSFYSFVYIAMSYVSIGFLQEQESSCLYECCHISYERPAAYWSYACASAPRQHCTTCERRLFLPPTTIYFPATPSRYRKGTSVWAGRRCQGTRIYYCSWRHDRNRSSILYSDCSSSREVVRLRICVRLSGHRFRRHVMKGIDHSVWKRRCYSPRIWEKKRQGQRNYVKNTFYFHRR